MAGAAKRRTGGGVAVRQGAAVNGPDGRFRPGGGLTEKQRRFVSLYVENGGNGKAAAQGAGYANPQSDAWKVMQLPHIADAIARERERSIMTEGASEAWKVLRGIVGDGKVLPAVRVKAATWILEAAGHGARRDAAAAPGGDKPLSEMTIAELEAFVSAGSEGLRKLREQRERTIDMDPGDALPAPDARDDARDDDEDPQPEPDTTA